MGTGYRTVKPLLYKIRCRNCSFAREFGVDVIAKVQASQHQRRNPTHRIELWALLEDRNPAESLAELPLDVDGPPF